MSTAYTGIFTGTPCIIAKQYKIQNKTSKYKLINWFYGKLYGYRYESVLPDGTDIMYFGDKIFFRNKDTFDKFINENNIETLN